MGWIGGTHTMGLHAVRRSAKRGTPFGDEAWAESMSRRLNLETTMRPQGRPQVCIQRMRPTKRPGPWYVALGVPDSFVRWAFLPVERRSDKNVQRTL